MTAVIERPGLTVHQGHCLDVLRTMPAESVHAVVTSPPYYGLRSYGTHPVVWDGREGCAHEWASGVKKGTTGGTASAKVRIKGSENFQIVPDSAHATCTRCGAWRGELGQEPNVGAFVAHLVDIFREVRRILRPDGTCWVNIGDGYSDDSKWGGATGGKHVAGLHGDTGVGRGKKATGVPAKNLLLVPQRLVIALQDDGWIVRSEIIWEKVAPMPESVEDRPTTGHEYVLMLAKSGAPTFWTHPERDGTRKAPAPDYRWRHKQTQEVVSINPNDTALWKRFNLWVARDYYFDAQAIAEPVVKGSAGSTFTEGKTGVAGLGRVSELPRAESSARNARTVWRIAPSPFSAARLGVVGAEHYAAFPADLPRRCLAAGTSERGCCAACGAPWARSVERTALVVKEETTQRTKMAVLNERDATKRQFSGGFAEATHTTTRWLPTCACADPRPPVPATCLDPFFGSGTTGSVAARMGRSCVGIEISTAYLPIFAARNAQMGMDAFARDGEHDGRADDAREGDIVAQ